jgi:nucleoid-associated protein YgaU
MTLKRLEQILAAYGAAPRRWPGAEREAALALLADSDKAQRLAKEARAIDRLLDAVPAPEATLDAASLAARVTAQAQEVTRLSAPAASRARFPFVLPNLIGLATAAAVGFVIGWADFGTGGDTTVTDLVPYVADLGGEDSLPW